MKYEGVAGWVFWLSLLFIGYTYLLYPLLLGAWAWLRPRPVRRAPLRPSVSVVVAAWNEAANIGRRVENLLAQDYPAESFDIVLVSDGSTDETPAVIEALAAAHPGRVRALVMAENAGKAAALNLGLEHARGEIVVFTDARQRFEPDAISRLAENFADPEVGSVSGELVLETGAGVAAHVGLYWKYETWLRRRESEVGSMLGATGAIYAIRRELWRPLPPGTLLDDFLTPMRIVLAGRRAVLDGRAVCRDQASSHGGQELMRKVRTLAGNFQAFALEPGLLLPWRNGATCWQVWSHKLARLLVPYALVMLLTANLALAGWFYWLTGVAQGGFYALALLGWIGERLGRPPRSRMASFAYTFTLLNAAAVFGLWSWARGRGGRNLWRKAYGVPPVGR